LQEQFVMGKWFRLAFGSAPGAQTVTATLDSQAVAGLAYSPSDTNGYWSGEINFGTGNHDLVGPANQPWEYGTNFTVNTTNSFTAQGNTVVDVQYDAGGNVTNRTFTGGRTQSLVWDGTGKLIRLTDKNGTATNYSGTAIYDAEGRRIRTMHDPGGTNSILSLTVDSYYDPQVEFLEVAAS